MSSTVNDRLDVKWLAARGEKALFILIMKNFDCHYVSDITAPACSYLPTQQKPASNYQGEPTVPKLRLHHTPYSPSAYVLYRITGADVARRITRRREHKETLPAQTQWHDSGCDVPRGTRHWPKHCGFRGSQWGSARAAAFAQCRTADTRRGRGVPQNEPVNRPTQGFHCVHTSAMQSGRFIMTRNRDVDYYSLQFNQQSPKRLSVTYKSTCLYVRS